MSIKHLGAKRLNFAENFYTSFDKLDGTHPWMNAVKEGFVPYSVRELKTGEIAYFNFILAKEMGLIPPDHPHELNEQLKNKLIETFSIQIINEYDELSKRRIDPSTIKPNKYMATRYLQLQHQNKQGKTSGDGRGIWNGTLSYRGKVWDISSRGTGVTCLSPGAVQANRPLKTGGTEFGYGCGLAEIDELLAASISAEIMHLQGINTERVLCVIDLGKGYGIGVRAAQNLIRPAHLFLYLKQEKYDALRAATDYLIDRQVQNKAWKIESSGMARYDEMLNYLATSFAQFAAQLDTDYIFAWLDWDGDNVLADAGIIDYGSIRQFGLRHDKYRYDDVERFSTNLNEQKNKARLIVQVFAQLTEYLKTGKRKSLKCFSKHKALEKFNQTFKQKKAERLLYRMGFDAQQRALIQAHPRIFAKFEREYSYFERAKISGKLQKVADGVNHPALYNMRAILRALPKYLAESALPLEKRTLSEGLFFKIIISDFAHSRDAKMNESQAKHIRNFQQAYNQLLVIAAGSKKPDDILEGLLDRAQKLNAETRITGNALIEIVDEMITEKRKGLSLEQLQKIIDRLVFEHNGNPEVPSSKFYKELSNTPAVKMDLYIRLLKLVEDNSQSI